MNVASDKRLLFVLLILSGITVVMLGVESFDDGKTIVPNSMVTTGVILLALLKVRIIIREFMEVRHAPSKLSRLMDLWVVLTAVSLLGGHFLGTTFLHG